MMKTPMLIHDLLSLSAQRYPQHQAVVFKERVICFGELDAKSSALARCLISLGVLPGDRVGLYLDKSIDAVLAIYGILKSGACYVPMDPLGPLERNALIINDCRLNIIITGGNKLFKLKQLIHPAASLKYLLIMDRDDPVPGTGYHQVRTLTRPQIFNQEASARTPVLSGISHNSPAYILYTSGSTGRPKGVVISHGAALAFIQWGLETFKVTPADILSGHAPFHFDLSIFDLFVPASAGASVSLIPQGMSSFPASLGEFIEKQRISIWYSVPSVLIQLGRYGGLENRDLSQLRHVLFAGEIYPSGHLRALMKLIPHAEFFNLYGPTETNVCTWYPVKVPPETDDPIPIGKPCKGQNILIVNDKGMPVDEGETGELCVSGPTLMNGYFHDAKQTANSILDDPETGTRKCFYKTGDLVHIDGNMNLVYHGRRDAMIKHRGYRIEPGEIESSLLSCSAVKAAVVWGESDPDDITGTRLVAWIETESGSELSEEEIRSFCARKLPKYMIPDRIRLMEAFPRTSTGKIDRQRMKCDDQ